MVATTVPPVRTDASWLRLTQVGIVAAVAGILVMGVSMLAGQVADSPGAEGSGDFHGAVDYVVTAVALPIGVGLLLAVLGCHRLQHGRDGRLGAVGVWVYGVCTLELVVQCMASVVVGAELIWGPAYPLCTLGLMVGLVLLAAGSWRVGLLPRWMLGVWPPLTVVGSFLGIGPLPLVFVVFLLALGVVLTRRVGATPRM